MLSLEPGIYGTPLLKQLKNKTRTLTINDSVGFNRMKLIELKVNNDSEELRAWLELKAARQNDRLVGKLVTMRGHFYNNKDDTKQWTNKIDYVCAQGLGYKSQKCF